ncbi:acylphosphatase [Candidatus Halobeggiatoa sp. HSG11]|nr:acylphosphatase [Candidatus Halobeggiatoa sp. HSG11]
MNICKRCFVSGRVQGVAFRYYTQQQAKNLGITGWATNLADGRVEVLACGELNAVNKLCSWLNQGPSLANVVEVKCQTETYFNIPNNFGIS